MSDITTQLETLGNILGRIQGDIVRLQEAVDEGAADSAELAAIRPIVASLVETASEIDGLTPEPAE